MKLEVGMYVRTKKHGICKIEGFASTLTDDYIENEKDSLILKDEIIKSSRNIIDLIEEGDFVNRDPVWLETNGKLFVGDVEQGYYLDEFKKWDIKIETIVTKEQFESMVYKVEE